MAWSGSSIQAIAVMAMGAIAPLLLMSSVGCGGGETITIVRDGQEIATFSFVLASTAAEREQGLRGRNTLDSGEALLISFPRATEACILNTGVTFAIDAVYAGENGSVRAIERAIPSNDDVVRCHPATLSVLEVGAGEAALIRLGDEFRR